MSEDYTYPAATDWRKRCAELERENAELRARLALVSEYAGYYAEEMSEGDPYELLSFTGWLAKRQQPPADEPDAPLTVADCDDGAEYGEGATYD